MKQNSFKDVSIWMPLRLIGGDLRKRWLAYLKLLGLLWLVFVGTTSISNAQSLDAELFTQICLSGVYFSFAVLFLFLLIWLTFKISILTLLKYPRGFIGGVGVGVFVMLLLIHVFKLHLHFFTPFQADLALPMMGLDLFCAVAITACAFSQNRPAMLATFFLAYNAVFFNVITIANDVNSWMEFLPFVYFVGALDLLMVGALLSKRWRKRRSL